jgi:hypothetical protein
MIGILPETGIRRARKRIGVDQLGMMSALVYVKAFGFEAVFTIGPVFTERSIGSLTG